MGIPEEDLSPEDAREVKAFKLFLRLRRAFREARAALDTDPENQALAEREAAARLRFKIAVDASADSFLK